MADDKIDAGKGSLAAMLDKMSGADIKQLGQLLAKMGDGGDTILAHINPEEAAMLRAHGGSGKPNAQTGLPAFEDGDGDGGEGNGGGDGSNANDGVDASGTPGDSMGGEESSSAVPMAIPVAPAAASTAAATPIPEEPLGPSVRDTRRAGARNPRADGGSGLRADLMIAGGSGLLIPR